MNDNNFAGNSRSAIDFLGNEWKYECMGCAISSGEIKIPGGIIYEGKHTILGADPEIPIQGFLIVNVKRRMLTHFHNLIKKREMKLGML